MQVEQRGVASRGLILFTLAGLLSLSSLGDQGCVIRILSGPPPGAGQGAPPPLTGPAGNPGAPGTTTTNPPTVQILSATTTEVNGYAMDSANPTSTAITVDLLPVLASTAGTTPTTPAPLLTTTANVSDAAIVNNPQQGHGFRFTLSQVADQTKVAAGQSIIVRATNTANNQVASTPATPLTAPTGTTTSTTVTTNTSPTSNTTSTR